MAGNAPNRTRTKRVTSPSDAVRNLRGVEIRLVLETNEGISANPDPALIKAVARAHQWFGDLMNEGATSLREIAKAEGG